MEPKHSTSQMQEDIIQISCGVSALSVLRMNLEDRGQLCSDALDMLHYIINSLNGYVIRMERNIDALIDFENSKEITND